MRVQIGYSCPILDFSGVQGRLGVCSLDGNRLSSSEAPLISEIKKSSVKHQHMATGCPEMEHTDVSSIPPSGHNRTDDKPVELRLPLGDPFGAVDSFWEPTV